MVTKVVLQIPNKLKTVLSGMKMTFLREGMGRMNMIQDLHQSK